MHKSATKCNETIGKWCKNKHGASKIIDTLETYQASRNCSIEPPEIARLRGGAARMNMEEGGSVKQKALE
jgi:hypothetical protein